MQGGQDGEFFAVEPAKINIFLQAVHGQKYGTRLQLYDGADSFAFVALAEGIARDIEIVGIFPHLEQQLIHRIAQREQADVGLQAQTQLGGIDSCEILGLERWVPETVERFDIGPFQARHVHGEFLALVRPCRMFLQPGHEARTKIAQGERLRRAINQICFGHSVKAATTEYGAQAGKIFGEGG